MQTVAATDSTRVTLATWRADIAILAVSLAVRLFSLPFSTIDNADSVTRIWIGWNWLEHPRLITEGVWGPLHFYLIGAVLAVWPDPVWAPTVLHLAFGAFIPLVVYWLALEMFGLQRAAVFAGLACAMYPAAVATSLAAFAETPFLLFLALSLLWLARARKADGKVWQAALAGGLLCLSSMVRYEAWMLTPFMGLLLLHRPKLLVAFAVPALAHPIFWMVGNFYAHGDPLYSIHWASNYERQVNGRAQLVTASWSLHQVVGFARMTARWLTPVLAMLIAWGVFRVLRERRREAVWLLPPLGLFVLLVAAAFHGSLEVKWRFTAVFGVLLIPFVALAFGSFGIENWSRRRLSATAAALVVGIGAFMIAPLWRSLPRGQSLAVSPVLDFVGQEAAEELLPIIQRSISGRGDALLEDFYGWGPTYYVALQTKLHPDQIHLTQQSPHSPLDPAAVEQFVRDHPSGLLIVREGGALSSMLYRDSAPGLELGDARVKIQWIGSAKEPRKPGVAPATLLVGRYLTLATAAPRASSPEG